MARDKPWRVLDVVLMSADATMGRATARPDRWLMDGTAVHHPERDRDPRFTDFDQAVAPIRPRHQTLQIPVEHDR